MTDPGSRARPTRMDVDLGAIAHNVRLLAERAGDAELCAVVKADGYGHGAVAVARTVLEAGATWLAVALIEEGEELRAAGVEAPILLLSEPPPATAGRLVDADLTASVCTRSFGEALDLAARERSRSAPVHLLVDTGMGRVGVSGRAWEELLAASSSWSHLDVTGIWTHFARADEPALDTTTVQLGRFEQILDELGETWLDGVVVHAANSAATLLHPRARFDLVRAGIAIYGLSPAPDQLASSFGLRQALRLTSEVSFTKRVTAGTPVSYGHTWSAPSDGWVATVPIGYADGVNRQLSNRAEAVLGGRRRPFVGNVTMDQILLWCGDDEPAVGDEVVLLGREEGDVTVDEWAAWLDTISYEIPCAISQRVPRVHLPAI